MNDELEARLDVWLEDMEEREPLKLFVIGGIVLIVFLLLVGVVTSRGYCYFTIDVMIQMGLLEDVVVPLVVVDVIRHAIASALIFCTMLLYLVDLETTWFLTQELIER